MLRHTLATLSYRCGKAMRGAPEGFSSFRAAPGTRSAGEIQAHISDLLDWALHLAGGRQVWHDSEPLGWEEGTARFFAAAEALDRRFAATGPPLACTAEQLFQGPIADALSHTGQIALLRRLAGAPIRGENYYRAEIAAGRVGREQGAPRTEFD